MEEKDLMLDYDEAVGFLKWLKEIKYEGKIDISFPED